MGPQLYEHFSMDFIDFWAEIMIFRYFPKFKKSVLHDPVVDFDDQPRVGKRLSYILRKHKI